MENHTGFKTFFCPMCGAENTRPKSVSCSAFSADLLALRNFRPSDRVCRISCAEIMREHEKALAVKQAAAKIVAAEPAPEPAPVADVPADLPVYETLFEGLVKVKVPSAMKMDKILANTTRSGHKVFDHYRHGINIRAGVYRDDGSVVTPPAFLNRLFFVPEYMRGQPFVFRTECRKKTMPDGRFYIFYDLHLAPRGTKPTHTIAWTSAKSTGIETEVKLHGDVEIWTRIESIPPWPPKAE